MTKFKINDIIIAESSSSDGIIYESSLFGKSNFSHPLLIIYKSDLLFRTSNLNYNKNFLYEMIYQKSYTD